MNLFDQIKVNPEKRRARRRRHTPATPAQRAALLPHGPGRALQPAAIRPRLAWVEIVK